MIKGKNRQEARVARGQSLDLCGIHTAALDEPSDGKLNKGKEPDSYEMKVAPRCWFCHAGEETFIVRRGWISWSGHVV